MGYTYKLGNNGPIAEVDDDIEITKEEYNEGGGIFSGPESWSLHWTRPGNSGVTKIERGVASSTGFKFTW